MMTDLAEVGAEVDRLQLVVDKLSDVPRKIIVAENIRNNWFSEIFLVVDNLLTQLEEGKNDSTYLPIY